MLGEIIAQHRQRAVLMHCLTNYVTANDCANLLLASGASAIMADDPGEVTEVTAICDGLILNMGTPHPRKLEAMLLAGQAANRLGHPVLLDPVGVGCSALRREAAGRLLAQVRLAAIRANASELATLAQGTPAHRGVDTDIPAPGVGGDGRQITEKTIQSARALARMTGAVVIVTGPTDLVTDGTTTYLAFNGHPMMRTVTGTGCQLSALAGAYITANPERRLEAALAAVCAMGLCGEIAHAALAPQEGNATYRNRIIDAIYHLSPEELEKGARYEAYP